MKNLLTQWETKEENGYRKLFVVNHSSLRPIVRKVIPLNCNSQLQLVVCKVIPFIWNPLLRPVVLGVKTTRRNLQLRPVMLQSLNHLSAIYQRKAKSSVA